MSKTQFQAHHHPPLRLNLPEEKNASTATVPDVMASEPSEQIEAPPSFQKFTNPIIMGMQPFIWPLRVGFANIIGILEICQRSAALTKTTLNKSSHMYVGFKEKMAFTKQHFLIETLTKSGLNVPQRLKNEKKRPVFVRSSQKQAAFCSQTSRKQDLRRESSLNRA